MGENLSYCVQKKIEVTINSTLKIQESARTIVLNIMIKVYHVEKLTGVCTEQQSCWLYIYETNH